MSVSFYLIFYSRKRIFSGSLVSLLLVVDVRCEAE